MERGVAILLGGFAVAGAVSAALLLTGVVKVDVALVSAGSISDAVSAIGTTVSVSLDKDGAIEIDGRSTTLKKLPSNLDDRFRAIGAKPDRREQTVVIWADPNVTKSDLDLVVRRLGEGGWTKIRLSQTSKAAT